MRVLQCKVCVGMELAGKAGSERTGGQGDKWHITAPNPLHFYSGCLIMMLHMKSPHPAAKEKAV